MQWLQRLVCSLVVIATWASAAPPPFLRPSVGTFNSRRQQQDGPIPITGIQGWGTQPRREIRDLQTNYPDVWNLYILGLQSLMAVNESDPLSFYQIAGIHGRPYIPWNNVSGVSDPTGGYCAHVSTVFPTWHRPYLALYEQTIFKHIVQVVDSFPAGAQRQRYTQAALQWRHPYWDWAMQPPANESTLPPQVSAINVTVNTPNGTKTIPNPLYSYQFHPLIGSDFVYNPFASWTQTMRSPSNWSSDAVQNDNATAQALDNVRLSLRDRVYNIFTQSEYTNYTLFSNEMWIAEETTPGSYDSLESIHDVIHNLVGGSGHMTYLDYSAFDPIFFLHHMMVDRLFALWQEINPNSWVEPAAQFEGTFAWNAGTVLNSTSPLKPFHSDTAGDFWTSDAIRSVQRFGYTYPELQGNNASVVAAINTLYGNTASSAAVSHKRKRATVNDRLQERSHPASHSKAQSDFLSRTYQPASFDHFPLYPRADRRSAAVPPAPTPLSPAEANDTTPSGQFREYLCNTRAEKFGLSSSYSVYVFLGDFNENNASNWAYEPNLVGTHAFFASVASSEMGNTHVMVSGVVPLTTTLIGKIEAGDLNSLGANDVAPYLQQNLQWRIALANGTAVDATDVPGLLVSVSGADVQPAVDIDSFPVWSDFENVPEATTGKAGGADS